MLAFLWSCPIVWLSKQQNTKCFTNTHTHRFHFTKLLNKQRWFQLTIHALCQNKHPNRDEIRTWSNVERQRANNGTQTKTIAIIIDDFPQTQPKFIHFWLSKQRNTKFLTNKHPTRFIHTAKTNTQIGSFTLSINKEGLPFDGYTKVRSNDLEQQTEKQRLGTRKSYGYTKIKSKSSNGWTTENER